MVTQTRLYTVEEFEQIADAPENSDRLLELIEMTATPASRTSRTRRVTNPWSGAAVCRKCPIWRSR